MNSNPAELEAAADLTVAACRRRGWLVLAGLTLVLVAVTAALTVLNVDLKLAGCFYDPGRGWFLGNEQPWQWLYRYGTIPGLVVTLAALVGWFAGKFRRNLAGWRPYCLLVVLTTVIASGILVNAVLKQYWGRPRPDQITAFGGQWTYRDVHRPGIPGQGGSFPCGHCAMGFTLVSLFFLRKRSKLIAYAGGGTGIVLGGALSMTRIVQGAHFLTDTLWSLGLNLIVAAALYYLVLAIPAGEVRTAATPVDRGRRLRLIAGLVVCLLLAVGAFATRRPFYESYPHTVNITPEIKTIIVRLNADPERFNVGYRESGPARVRLDSHGFGWMYFNHRVAYVSARAGQTLIMDYRVNPVSYFAELYHAIDLQLPVQYRGRLDIRLEYNPEAGTLEKTAQ
jgi:lipid A 4'-phosphatase